MKYFFSGRFPSFFFQITTLLGNSTINAFKQQIKIFTPKGCQVEAWVRQSQHNKEPLNNVNKKEKISAFFACFCKQKSLR